MVESGTQLHVMKHHECLTVKNPFKYSAIIVKYVTVYKLSIV